MPELPEVETIVRALAPRLQGKRIIFAEVLAPRVIRHCQSDVPSSVAGRKIQAVERRGKFIVVHLDDGALTIHLGMTGQLLFDAQPTPYTRAIFQLEDGALLYDDIRMFGSIEWTPAVPNRVERLGPEPLRMAAEEFYRSVHVRKASIKAVLLNQTVVRGLGNIYTDEALFRAGIRPQTPASRLSRKRANRLLDAIQEVLVEAIEHRGSSVSDYVDTEGRRGGFQQRHRVYDRAGEPCLICGAAIRRTVVAQRGTHFCPRCQR
jgi:formamidopyrimidine-DNA glycosylase